MKMKLADKGTLLRAGIGLAVLVILLLISPLGAPLLYGGNLRLHWFRLKHADFSSVQKDAGAIVESRKAELERLKQNRKRPSVSIPPAEWPQSVRSLNPKMLYAEEANVFLWWGDHWGEYGIRVFQTNVSADIANASSSFVRTFECSRIAAEVWLYKGD
jgi:hypothetical protein